MAWCFNPYSIPVILTAVILLLLARVAWLQRKVVGAPTFMALMIMLAAWSLLYAVELACASLDGKLLLVKIEYFFIEIFPISWLIFVLQYTGRQHWVTFRRLGWLVIFPMLIWIALWMDPFFHLFYLSADLIRQGMAIMIVTRYGPAFWLHSLFQYGIAMLAIVFCVQGLFLPAAIYRKQSIILLTGALVMVCCNLITVTKHSPFPNFDLTPISALGMGLVATIGLIRFHLLDIMPVARGAIIENMSDGVIILDAERRVVDVNPTALLITEVHCDTIIGLVADEAFANWPAFMALLAGDQQFVTEITRDVQGICHTFDMRSTLLVDRRGQSTGRFIILRDVTEMKQTEDELRASETRYRQLYTEQQSGCALHDIITDAEGRVVDYVTLDVNPAYATLLGVSRDAVVGQRASELLPPEELRHWLNIFGPVTLQGISVPYEVYSPANDKYFEGIAYRPAAGQFAVVFVDITARKQAEARLSHLAYYDELTGLPNRVLFLNRTTYDLARAHRQQETVALLFLDLDHFKEVNDTQGHSVGDRLLQEVARRLTACVRESDTVARLGGDEFVISLTGLANPSQDSEITARRILDTIVQPFDLDGVEFFISSSIGITLFPDDGDNIETLMRHADIAMYRAKARGRNTLCFYSADMSEQLEHRHQLAGALRHALQAGELYLVYQPQVESLTHTTFGVEALLRWHHPTRGEISPLEFIPLAEEIGLIETIGQWVLQTACAQMRAWRDAGCGDVRVAVNLSARQFERRHIVETVRDALAATGLPPTALELEITESTAMEDIAYAIETLGQLRDLGVHIAIDDFGTGHCSFGYLKRFPVSTLKIDHTFISEILTDAGNAAIVQALVVLGDSLGLSMVAEYVESVPQLKRLHELGCRQFQGFLFSKPLLPHECEHLLTHHVNLWNQALNRPVIEDAAAQPVFDGQCAASGPGPIWN